MKPSYGTIYIECMDTGWKIHVRDQDQLCFGPIEISYDNAKYAFEIIQMLETNHTIDPSSRPFRDNIEFEAKNVKFDDLRRLVRLPGHGAEAAEKINDIIAEYRAKKIQIPSELITLRAAAAARSELDRAKEVILTDKGVPELLRKLDEAKARKDKRAAQRIRMKLREAGYRVGDQRK